LVTSQKIFARKKGKVMFEVADAYERQMGRWSRLLAPLFVEFLGVREGDRFLDAGCGTGSLAMTVATMTKASTVCGIDASKAFIEYASSHNSDPRVSFQAGDVQNLPFARASFDRCAGLLVVNHIPDAPKAVGEMRRVTKSGGVVGTAMWDGTGGNEFNDRLWDSAIALDPAVQRPSEGPRAYSSAQALSSLWEEAGLSNVEVQGLMLDCRFKSFDDLWNRYVEGQGPGGTYVRGLTEIRRNALRETLRRDVLRDRSDGSFTLKAKAWAVKGRVL
jgi:ubiquinone/menaquinone biosynthesis C-methylase UbiE